MVQLGRPLADFVCPIIAKACNPRRLVVIILMVFGLLMGARAWPASILMVNNPAWPVCCDQNVFLSAKAFAADDMVAVGQFNDRVWPADYRTRVGRNLGLAFERLEVGERVGAWTVSFFHREDWRLSGDRDAVDGYYLNQSNGLTSQVRTYEINYDLTGFSADGGRLALSAPLATQSGRLTWGLAVSLMHASDVRIEHANGRIVVSQVGMATVDVNRSLYDSLLKPVPPSSSFNAFTPATTKAVPAGWGYGFDAGLSWQDESGLRLGAAVNDLLGHIYWKTVPVLYQNINGRINGTTLTSNTMGGVIQGRGTYQSLTLLLKPKLRLEADYQSGVLTYSTRFEQIGGNWFPQLGVCYTPSRAISLTANYETRFGSFGIGIESPHYYLNLGAQNLDLHASRALSFSAGVSFKLP